MSEEAAERSRLVGQIREAFPRVQFQAAATDCNCEECVDIRNALRGKSWDELPTEFVDSTCSPTLFTPEATQAFLPAFLLRALDDLSGERVVLEFTVYSLTPEISKVGDEWSFRYKRLRLLAITALMSVPQIEAIRAFLLFVAEHAEDREYFNEKIASALATTWRTP